MTDPTPPVRERFFRLWRAAAPRVAEALARREAEVCHA